jgi:hypothetical protein
VIASGVSRPGLSALANALGREAVVAHQPGNKAVLFPFDANGDVAADVAELRAKAQGVLPDARYRYGVTGPYLDRVLMSDKSDPNAATIPYSRFGANPRTAGYADLESRVLGSPLTEDFGGALVPTTLGYASR